MKKSASPKPTEKRAKRTPEEKAARKSAKKTGQAASVLNDDRADNKASQKKTLKTAAKQLQKELNNRMSEVVTRIRKETKAKLKEVVKEATRRLDGDTERMFEQALQTIVRHYDSIASTADNAPASSDSEEGNEAATSPRGAQKGQTLNKDGTPRKTRATSADEEAAGTDAPAPKARGRKPGSAAAGARRGPKPGTPASGARRGPKPRVQATAEAVAPDTTDVTTSADSAGTGEVSA